MVNKIQIMMRKKMIDKRSIKKNIFPIFLCIGVWGLTILFLLTNLSSAIKTIALILLLTVQAMAALSDIYSRIIPFKLTLVAVCLGVLISIIYFKPNITISYIAGGLVAFIIMKLLVLFSKNQIGGGDLALMTVTGLFTGINYVFGIFFTSVLLAGVYSIAMILIKKADKKTEIPFAPFILIATCFVLII
jgi:leader peptidase (prepilin peptidase)/N-methyltransferase